MTGLIHLTSWAVINPVPAPQGSVVRPVPLATCVALAPFGIQAPRCEAYGQDRDPVSGPLCVSWDLLLTMHLTCSDDEDRPLEHTR